MGLKIESKVVLVFWCHLAYLFFNIFMTFFFIYLFTLPLIVVDLIIIYRVFFMYFCNLNVIFTLIFLKITLIHNLLMFCKIRRKIKQSNGVTNL